MASAPEPLPPPTNAAVAAALIAAADGAPLLANLSGREISPSIISPDLQWIDMASGWKLVIWWAGGSIGPLHRATAPDGASWTLGCARWPDWNAGPQAEVLDPIRHLLTPEQRERLRVRLLDCTCWPEQQPPPLPPPAPARFTDGRD